MKHLAYLAFLSLLATGMALAQNPSAAGQDNIGNSSGNASAQTSQQHNKTPRRAADQSSDSTGQNAWTAPATSPSTVAPVPTLTIHDRPAPAASPSNVKDQAGQQRIGNLGTTGKTPETSAPERTPPDQQPSVTSTTDGAPPRTSLVSTPGIHSNLAPMGTLASLSHKPPHGPDAGTRPNPEAVDNTEASAEIAAPMPH